MIFEPRHNYHGLFLEVKKEGTIIYRKDGDLTANAHIRKQEEILHNRAFVKLPLFSSIGNAFHRYKSFKFLLSGIDEFSPNVSRKLCAFSSIRGTYLPKILIFSCDSAGQLKIKSIDELFNFNQLSTSWNFQTKLSELS